MSTLGRPACRHPLPCVASPRPPRCTARLCGPGCAAGSMRGGGRAVRRRGEAPGGGVQAPAAAEGRHRAGGRGPAAQRARPGGARQVPHRALRLRAVPPQGPPPPSPPPTHTHCGVLHLLLASHAVAKGYSRQSTGYPQQSPALLDRRPGCAADAGRFQRPQRGGLGGAAGLGRALPVPPPRDPRPHGHHGRGAPPPAPRRPRHPGLVQNSAADGVGCTSRSSSAGGQAGSLPCLSGTAPGERGDPLCGAAVRR